MPQLIDVATAEPPFAIAQEDAAAFARARFGTAMPHIERLMPLFANTGIRSRRICKEPSWYETDSGIRRSRPSSNEGDRLQNRRC